MPSCISGTDSGRVDFFISYTGKDVGWAEWVAWVLEEAGHTTRLQAWDFRPGGNFVVEMDSGVEAERTIAVLSPDYLQSRFGKAEWAAVFADDPTGEKGKLVPVRVRACDPTGLLKARIYIDLVGVTDETEAKRRLLDGLKEGRAKPAAAPAFPGARTVAASPGFPGALPAIWNLPPTDYAGQAGGICSRALPWGHIQLC